jgi:hypothetical protein
MRRDAHQHGINLHGVNSTAGQAKRDEKSRQIVDTPLNGIILERRHPSSGCTASAGERVRGIHYKVTYLVSSKSSMLYSPLPGVRQGCSFTKLIASLMVLARMMPGLSPFSSHREFWPKSSWAYLRRPRRQQPSSLAEPMSPVHTHSARLLA